MAIKHVALASLALLATALTLYLSTNAPVSHKQYLRSFIAHKNKFNKTHASKEELAFRLSIFTANKRFIADHNSKKKSFTVGEGPFTDLTFAEFKNKYLTTIPMKADLHQFTAEEQKTGSVDWVREGKVSGVKNQEQCGSCWAFSATGSMESAYMIFKGENKEFSEQELVDCSSSYGNHGCNGGIMSMAFDYVEDKELSLEGDYTYTARKSHCKSSEFSERYGISDYNTIDPVNVNGLMTALDTQPVSVAIEVQQDFMHYNGGVYESSDDECGESLNHGVLAVGYNSGNGEDWLKVKNSWSTMWGEEGYIRMKIGTGAGTCGIANGAAVYPSL